MNAKSQYTLAALVRVDALLTEHAADLPDAAKSVARHELPELVSRMREHGTVQRERTIQARGETEVQRVTRLDVRRRYVVPVAKIAKLTLQDVPHFADLTLPETRLKGSAFVSAIRAMASTASQYTEVFVANGLAADFAAKMTEAANTMERSLAERDSHRLSVVGRTANAREDVGRGRTLLGMLDTLVRAALTNNPALLAKWKSARRVSTKPGMPVGSASSVVDKKVEGVTPLVAPVQVEVETPVPAVKAAA